jgi:hypothetical protein
MKPPTTTNAVHNISLDVKALHPKYLNSITSLSGEPMMTSPEIRAKMTPILAPFWNSEKAIGYVAYLGIGRTIPIIVANRIDKKGLSRNTACVISIGKQISSVTPIRVAMKKAGIIVFISFRESTSTYATFFFIADFFLLTVNPWVVDLGVI